MRAILANVSASWSSSFCSDPQIARTKLAWWRLELRKLFQGAAIPTFRTPEPAVDLFSHVSNYYRNRQLLMQTPASISEQAPPRLVEVA